MSTALEDMPLTQLIPSLWKGRPNGSEEAYIGINIPHTVIYEHNFPKGLFHTSPVGSLHRRTGKDIDSRLITETFSFNSLGFSKQTEDKPETAELRRAQEVLAGERTNVFGSSLPSDIIASYIERDAEALSYSVQYFTEEGLQAFLLGAAVKKNEHAKLSMGPVDPSHSRAAATLQDVKLIQNKNGILQRFVYPLGDHNELIQVVWTGHLCITEKLQNRYLLSDTTKTPFERAATFQGPPSFSHRAYVAPKVCDAVRGQCERLVEFVYNVDHKAIEQMTLYFKVDNHERLWLLWCSSMRFATAKDIQLRRSPSPSSDQKGVARLYAKIAVADEAWRLSETMLPKFSVPTRYQGSVETSVDLSAVTELPGGKRRVFAPSNRPMTSLSALSTTTKVEDLLQLPLPKVEVRVLEQTTKGFFVPPTQSRLCPKMPWKKRKGPPLPGVSSTTISEKKPGSIKSSVKSGLLKDDAVSEYSAVGTAKSERNMLRGPSRSRQRSPRDLNFLGEAELPSAKYTKTVYTMPSDEERARNLAAHKYDCDELIALANAPLHSLFQTKDSQTETMFAESMRRTKKSLVVVVGLIDALREVAYAHFLSHSGPLAFSIPTFLVPCARVADALISLFTELFSLCPSPSEAVQHDLEAGRMGVLDDLSYHHLAETNEEMAASLRCFLVESHHQIHSLSARLASFYLVDLRNIHAEVESSLLTAQYQQQRASNPQVLTPVNSGRISKKMS